MILIWEISPTNHGAQSTMHALILCRTNKGRKMKKYFLYILISVLLTPACQSPGSKDTLASLREKEIVVKEEEIRGGMDKAMESYQRFLEDTPENPLAPEAIRRLADLKIEKEYGEAIHDI